MVDQRKRKLLTSDESSIENAGDHADFHGHTLEKPKRVSGSCLCKSKEDTSNDDDINSLLLLSEVCWVEMSNRERARNKLIAEIRESHQKNEVALQNKGKEPFSSGPKQGAYNTPPSSRMTIFGQNICSSQNDAANSGSVARLLELLKDSTKKDNWSEVELDALWIGVRRFGQHNWIGMLADPAMCILKKRTPQELATKWKAETLKLFPTVNKPVLPTPNTNNALGPGIGRFPFGVDNEALRNRWSNMFLSKNHKNKGSASSFHSIQRAASDTGNESKAIQTFTDLNVSTKRQQDSTSTNVHQLQQQLQLGRNFLFYDFEKQLKSLKEHPLQIRRSDDSSNNK